MRPAFQLRWVKWLIRLTPGVEQRFLAQRLSFYKRRMDTITFRALMDPEAEVSFVIELLAQTLVLRREQAGVMQAGASRGLGTFSCPMLCRY